MKALAILIMLTATWAFGLMSAHCFMDHIEPPQVLPLVHADWTSCHVDRRGDPLGPQPSPKNNFPRRMDRA